MGYPGAEQSWQKTSVYIYIYVIQNLTVFPSFPNSPHLGVEDVIISHHYYVILIRKMADQSHLFFYYFRNLEIYNSSNTESKNACTKCNKEIIE